jgi:hypothetical protein
MTATVYNIYLVNQSTTTQTFWCFLAPPQELVNDPHVFANSSASLAVQSNYQGTASFGIPVQYVVGAGAGNHAVGLSVKIVSDVTCDASLEQLFDANYATVPPQEGPTMNPSSSSPANTIAIKSNAFNQQTNEAAGWFSNMSFGILTEAGFVGMTWPPSPQDTRTLTPKLTFYIATGDYDSNALASWDDVSNSSVAITVPASFQDNNCTVTYDSSGNWSQTPGAPVGEALTSNLSWFLSDRHSELVALAYASEGKIQSDNVKSVSWNQVPSTAEGEVVVLTGTLTVTAALVGAFTYFVLGGVNFSVTNAQPGGTTFSFRYSGTKSAKAVMDLFTAGAQVLFGGSGK